MVAKCDRNWFVSSWEPYRGNVAPGGLQIEFSSVQHLTPRQFVEKLSVELGVCGVVAGENWRFGNKAAGDASEAVCGIWYGGLHCEHCDGEESSPIYMESRNLKEQGQLSSTCVRHALAAGDMKYVSELLGRNHRLMLKLKDRKVFVDNSWKL